MSLVTEHQSSPSFVSPRVVGRARVITVASGKGGVGKTQLSVNLATALARVGQRVLLIDGDLGLANVNVLLGLSHDYNAAHLLDGSQPFNRVVTSFRGKFDLLPAGNALAYMAELDIASQVRLMESLELYKRPYDFVIMDACAGIGGNVRLTLSMADETLVVMSPETTSLTDAYALIKVAARSGCKGPFNVIVNPVRVADQAREMFACLEAASRSFLGVEIGYAGYVYRDQAVERSTREQVPFVESSPGSPASKCVEALALRILGEDGVSVSRKTTEH
ncbi:MAG: MinD/ParA family protein [Myxococcales bacterium]|nr:MinD/ParA family protein [Myxococcales bacterium]